MNENSMTPERKEHLYQKKDILYRKAHGKMILDNYLSKVAYMFPFEKQPELLPLEETDAALEQFRLVSSDLAKETAQISVHELCLELLAIQGSGKSFYVLIDDDWRYCGILKIEKIETLNVALEFGNTIMNDLFFISVDMSLAINLDFFEVDGVYVIDIEKWRI